MPVTVSDEMVKQARSADWYVKDLTTINDAARELFEKYSAIPPDRVLQHIVDTRERAFEIYPYPCLGRFRFLELHLRALPVYSEAVERVKSGEKLLDVGCCVGQELRRLAFDGAPSENLYGSDFQKEFLDLGYDLFIDRETFRGKFIQADILDPKSELNSLQGQLGMISANSFFHLFQWDDQLKAAKQLVELFNPGPGNLIMGRQVGRKQANDFTLYEKIGHFYSHSPESWKQLWTEVGEATGTKWDVEAHLYPFEVAMSDSKKQEFQWLQYTVRRI